ncbi:MAG: ABC transporter ATP-binding protein [Treponema sp.]|nr:ABC transporter ATP-binding protein [Treponema sp.]
MGENRLIDTDVRAAEFLLRVSGLSVGIQQDRRLLVPVRDLDFEIGEGEILGIVGESGCGKSLTAFSLAGLLPKPARVLGGRAVFRNETDLFRLEEEAFCRIRGKEISFIFQEPFASLNPLMKIGAQIAETLEVHGEKDRKLSGRRVLELMEKLELPDPETLCGAYPHQLSGGMCQRVMIALAVIAGPRLLIADEPTTALDLTTQAQILKLIKGLNREQGTAVLFISHDLSVINSLCDRVLVMYAGRVMEEGPVKEVFSRPAHEYTRGLLASIPARNPRGRPLAAIPGMVPPAEEAGGGGCPFIPRCPRAEKRCLAPAERRPAPGRRTFCVQEEP